MPRSSVPAFINGDRCEDGQGSIGFARQCRGAKGPYVKVYISQGPKAGSWEYPEKFCRRPAIDWSTDGQLAECVECGRRFRVDASAIRRIFCVTCESFQKKTDTRRAADTSLAEYRWRPKVYASEQARRDADESPF